MIGGASRIQQGGENSEPFKPESPYLSAGSLTGTGNRKLQNGDRQSGGDTEEHVRSAIRNPDGPAGSLVIMTARLKLSGANSTEYRNETSQIENRAFGPEPKNPTDICEMSEVDMRTIVSQFEEAKLQNYVLGSPAVDDLLTLIPFNMYRALISNAHALGYRMDEMNHDNALSRFNSNMPRFNWQCPVSLRPTMVQRQIPHHPWLDLFPIPQMRDNLILAGNSLDDTELCIHLVGFASGRSIRPGIAIWGEAWNPLCWELTEEFVQRWKWALKDCEVLLKSSNHWRIQRGETPITL